MTTQLHLETQPNTPVARPSPALNQLPLYLALIPLLLLTYPGLTQDASPPGPLS